MSIEVGNDRSKPDNTVALQLLHDSFTDTPQQTALQILRGTSVAGLKATSDTPAATTPATPPPVEQQPAKTACADSPDYRGMINTFFGNAYDVPTKEQRDKLVYGFNCDIKSHDDIIKTANEALKTTGDAYNKMFTPKEWQAMRARLSGHFFGVGMELVTAPIGSDGKPLLAKTKAEADEISKRDIPNKEPVVLKPLPNTPASEAGFQKGDIITHVSSDQGSFDTTHMPLEDVVDKIRGPLDTPVHITVERDGQPLERDLVRKEIIVKTVDEPKQLENGITYIKIHNFGDETETELQDAILKFKDSKGFVIDVRDNSGGLVRTSVGATEFFIKNGNIVTVRERESSSPDNPKYSENTYSLTKTNVHEPIRPEIWSDQPRLPYLAGDKPIVVLTNGGTASGAEIFTGALHDTAHAVTLGEDTFGKGIGQVVGPSQFGAGFSVTDLHYFTPSGIWPGDAASEYKAGEDPVNRHRLQPDFKVVNPDTAEVGTVTDVQLNEAIHLVSSKMIKAPAVQP
jgi:C-terminal peptidase prc